MGNLIDDRIKQLQAENELATTLLKQNMDDLSMNDFTNQFNPSSSSFLHANASISLNDLVKLSTVFLSKSQKRNLELFIELYKKIRTL